MEITFQGGNCIALTTKKAKVVIDDNLEALGKTSIVSKADVAIYTNDMLKGKTKTGDAFVIDGPGEYEIKEVSVHGVPARAHMDEENTSSATVFRLAISGVMIMIAGHIHPDLSDAQLEEIGMVDMLIIPVGGNGYTLDATGAAKLVKKVGPKIVIPTHYNEKGLKFEVPQGELDDFIKELGTTAHVEDKLKIKNGIIPDVLTVYQLTH